MRTEQEMLNLILSTARQDERIRAVILNGSRANPNAHRDLFQDFDILYIVTDVAAFRDDARWVDRFGERIILQLPDTMASEPPESKLSFAWLMQLADGNRIDLTVFPVNKLDQLAEDSLTVVLLDKDNLFLNVPPATEKTYLPHPPTTKAFTDCCNEFWWVSPYVAKGLWRNEIPYARFMLEDVLRVELDKMLVWLIGVRTKFELNPGKCGKRYKELLTRDEWDLWLRTCAGADEKALWGALFAMGDLFRLASRMVAEHFRFEYPQGDDEKVTALLKRILDLPRDAVDMP